MIDQSVFFFFGWNRSKRFKDYTYNKRNKNKYEFAIYKDHNHQEDKLFIKSLPQKIKAINHL